VVCDPPPWSQCVRSAVPPTRPLMPARRVASGYPPSLPAQRASFRLSAQPVCDDSCDLFTCSQKTNVSFICSSQTMNLFYAAGGSASGFDASSNHQTELDAKCNNRMHHKFLTDTKEGAPAEPYRQPSRLGDVVRSPGPAARVRVSCCPDRPQRRSVMKVRRDVRDLPPRPRQNTRCSASAGPVR
jgi:hypothetical protein